LGEKFALVLVDMAQQDKLWGEGKPSEAVGRSKQRSAGKPQILLFVWMFLTKNTDLNKPCPRGPHGRNGLQMV